MPPAADLRVPVRLTRSEMWLISFGLRLVEGDYELWRRRRAPGSIWAIKIPAATPNENDTIEQIAAITNMLNLVRNNSQATRRLHLNSVELAACAVGVRITCLQAQKRKGARWIRRNHRATVNNLLTKLENRRKAAKLLHIRTHGKEQYQAARGRWHRHVEWMHKDFANAYCLSDGYEPYHWI